MIKDPVIRHKPSIKLAHDTLADIVHAMFVMPFVHLGYLFDLASYVWKVITMVILPDVVETMYLMRANGGSHVAAAGFGWKLHRGPNGMIDTLIIRG